jgi:hypothetical protein
MKNVYLQLNVFGEYCKKWKLKVNAEKTKIFIFSRGRPLVDIHFSLNGSEIEIVNEFNYLLVSMILISIVIYKIVIVFFSRQSIFLLYPQISDP